MFFAALLGITLVPVLMLLCIRGKITPEIKNPVNRFLIWAYQPVVHFVLRFRWLTLIIGALLVLWVFYPWRLTVTQPLQKSLPESRAPSTALGAIPGGGWLASLAKFSEKYLDPLFPYQN